MHSVLPVEKFGTKTLNYQLFYFEPRLTVAPAEVSGVCAVNDLVRCSLCPSFCPNMSIPWGQTYQLQLPSLSDKQIVNAKKVGWLTHDGY